MSLRVVVLSGGPDREREVSLAGGRCVADALVRAGHEVVSIQIETLTPAQVRDLPEGVIFPVLHGPWGEGGTLQRMLEDAGRMFVGSGSRASQTAMDKARTLAIARNLDIPTAESCVFEDIPERPPIACPVVVKPVCEGSSVGVRICHDDDAWSRSRAQILSSSERGPWLVERFVRGRELTVALLDGRALPIIEIRPACGTYDYAAKYERDDTTYLVDPDLPAGIASRLGAHSVRLAEAIGVRHMARVDFLLDEAGEVLLEINTIPGFTDHSLLPMAARAAGFDLPELCTRLVAFAIRDAEASDASATPVERRVPHTQQA